MAVALTAGVSLTAQHIPDIQNVVADTACRQIETEWTLVHLSISPLVHLSENLHTRLGPLFIPFTPPSTQVCLEVPRIGGSGCGCIPSGLEQMDLSNISSRIPSAAGTEED